MFNIFLSTVLAFIITLFTIPVIIFLARNLQLFDLPDSRKIHIAPIPSLGGLGIFAGLSLTILITIPFYDAFEFQYFIAAFLIIFFIGFKDDILATSPLKKLFGQSVAALLIIYKGGIKLENMQGFCGVYELSPMLSFLLSFFTIIVVINSINLIDGIDGLAGSFGLMISTILGFYFLLIDITAYSVLSFSLAGSLLAFLIFNYAPAKIFMGDTGSLLIGLICAILVIKFINVSSNNFYFPIQSAPAVGFSLLIIPLLDTLRVFTVRLVGLKSPFSPDRNHIHHLLLKRGFSHLKITTILIGANISFIISSYFLGSVGSTGLIFVSIILYFSAVKLLDYSNNKKGQLLSNSKAFKSGSVKKVNANILVLKKGSVIGEN